MKTLFPFVLLVLLFQSAYSQSPKYRLLNVPVERNTIQLRQPWVGGMNSPQFSPIDLNCDNRKDLFVFDRVGSKVLTYINNGSNNDSAFTYAPAYEKFFPAMTAWALIHDYNEDGVPDIFAHANSGTMVFKGSLQNGQLRFDTVSSLLLYYEPPYTTNIYTSIADLPVFVDVNFDGDIDVLTYTVLGGQVEYYENQHKEHPGDIHYAVDSFKFLKIGTCWGDFVQSSLDNTISLHANCKGDAGGGLAPQVGGGSRHAGNAIFSLDDGNDHDIDLLNGNLGFDNLTFLENGGDSSYANMTRWDSVWPLCSTHAILPTYPAAFGADYNNDGFDDILISPNASDGARDVKNVMLYKNVNNSLCNYEYQSDSFLVHDLLDFGTDSKPVFFDFNGDGLKDIMIGNYGYFRPFTTYQATIAYYENIGTATEPKFKERTIDYDKFSDYNLVAAFPAFGDLNGDGYQDMVVGDLNGYVHYFKNYGTVTASFPTMDSSQWSKIDVGQFSAPFMYDMNGDSLLDLLVGRKDGKISYFWNMGTRTVPYFHKDSVNNFLGNISVTAAGFSEGSSQPSIYKMPGGALRLFVGSNIGRVFEYEVNTANLRSGSFNRVDTNVLGYDVGSKAVVTIADINSDGFLDYLVGNSRGGLLLYSDALLDSSAVFDVCQLSVPTIAGPAAMQIYPNPASNYFTCVIEGADLSTAKVEVFNILGERIAADVNVAGNRVTVNTANWNSGFYIARITNKAKQFTGKILIER